MKMIWHQAPRQNIGIRCDVIFGLLNEKKIILPIEKEDLRIISSVVNVVNIVCFKLHVD
jgi:hypothetical protein